MGLNIKNERVYELAKELSQLKGESMTTVILRALEDEMQRMRALDDAALARRLKAKEELYRFIKSRPKMPAGVTSDHSEFYDKDGLPA